MKLASYAYSRWIDAAADAQPVASAIDGATVALASSSDVDFAAVAQHARQRGLPALRRLTFQGRAGLLKKLAQHLSDHKAALYDLSFQTGATKRDSAIDIDGGIGTLFAYAGLGRRELPDSNILLDGPLLPLSRQGSFVGRHIETPLDGIAIHVNAYNFPCWGMLEKLAPALLAGVPCIVKPATQTAYLTAAMVRLIVDSGLLPEGVLQLICGRLGDLLDHVTGQDLVSFTGSLETSLVLRNHPAVARNATRFVAERDSLNAAILGTDVAPGSPEFDIFIREVAREMTVKAGQKCTAVRRILVPAATIDAVSGALAEKLSRVVVGDPRVEGVTMGPLVGLDQREDVRRRIEALRAEADLVLGDIDNPAVKGADAARGGYLPPILLRARDPKQAAALHQVEAFGPVATLVAYDDVTDAVALSRRGEGSLVATAVTRDPEVAAELAFGLASYHGRLHLIDRDSAGESTGHGSPLPGLVHGGPGRAGGGEELGGIRGVHHYLQRTAVQGSPALLTRLAGHWNKGAPEVAENIHPFRRGFEALALGETIHTRPRTVTLADIEHFAHFTGDTFYAHMDEAAAKANPFFPGRVAHGYLILSFAAGLFVEPAPGPVLANYGLDSLRFLKPVSPDDTIAVRLTVKQKSPRNADYGEVRWDVEVTNQNGETVATYELLTLNALTERAA
ncbi:phenylacetic acid degradation bifunctional protein PaaZ [Zavarzinia compransoris]|uniref:phenylacetic acid degradation bifunctional protein PaaZ n=1 Tax=Zavarzinia compransoris TaxID=1264899 RepID=UPI0010E1127A|nr:phenylacetic acid degradation bifunctional protein PaaZ [Zavarzinia compransoris]TDP40091.1 oxepin-CoA hydrolase/3-oxo-5,6-dehydrosuberyl-CoA semialdehyde dehydrogenase [Zavarzinia compransoris]